MESAVGDYHQSMISKSCPWIGKTSRHVTPLGDPERQKAAETDPSALSQESGDPVSHGHKSSPAVIDTKIILLLELASSIRCFVLRIRWHGIVVIGTLHPQ